VLMLTLLTLVHPLPARKSPSRRFWLPARWHNAEPRRI